jgi:hypothetical protein
MKGQIKIFTGVTVLALLCACATYDLQTNDQISSTDHYTEKKIAHSFYLIGDAGYSSMGAISPALQGFTVELNKASENSTAVFLGDNIYPKGLPSKGAEGRALAEHRLKVQIDAVKDFKGRTIFIPGNHDWYSNGLKGLKRQEKYVEDALGKNSFLPENGCPLEKVDISDDIVMILVDSEWYITNWDKHPTFNDDCEIKTRVKFFDELEGLIKKARGKTTIIALHHPMFTNGPHGGQYDLKSHLMPVPGLGTLKNVLRETSGVSPADLQNKRYNEFKKHVVTLAQENDKTIFVSGHEHSLQYIVQDNLPQIVSGSGSKISATRIIGGGLFSYGAPGFARLDVFVDGSSYVRFYTSDNYMVYQSPVLAPADPEFQTSYGSEFPSEVRASIYSKEETAKGRSYRSLWGERYRKYYSTEVLAPTVNLDTLFGGLTPVRKGGGHQSVSLRLEDKEGREYVMRAMRKNAIQYIQSVAFKDKYMEGKFKDTYTEGLLMDIFTGAHPYAPFTVATLSDAIGVYHSNPVLYYVPKQDALGGFNNEFGDELYMIEERAADGHGDKASFGFSDELISTDDLLKKIHKNEDHILDEAAYVRARLFDMVIGDWDRHEDQWRWATFKDDEKTVYSPVPRDRDQVFSIMSDGSLLGFATSVIPALRLMKSYEEELKSPKWFNLEPYPLDVALIAQADRNVWNSEVQHIVENLTDEVIDEAFTYFPEEVRDQTVTDIKRKLKGRIKNLQRISDTYYNHVNKFAVIKGTNKDDWFDISRMPNGITKVTGYRIKKGEKGDVFHERTYSHQDTKEIWIYGLDDDDVFRVSGNGDDLIKVRLIGGQNKDTYTIENGKRVKLYDFKSKKSVFTTNNGSKKLTDDYETNVYDYKKLKNSSNQVLPAIGINPDDGLKLGFKDTFTTFGFDRNPFTSQHVFSAGYYFATSGFDLGYYGEFANVIGNFNLGIDAAYTSPNYSINFFGFGNDTPNFEADDNDGIDVDLDYNRVKIRKFTLAPSLIWRGQLGAYFKFGVSYESIDVEETEDRFINAYYMASNRNNENEFIGVAMGYGYSIKDHRAFTTLGMDFNLDVGYKSNVNESNGFGFIIPSLSFDYKLIPSGQLVLATKFKGHFNIGDDFEFFQGASMGGDDGLRGYRNQRFTGKSGFYQSTDLRLNMRRLKSGLLPVNIGIFGGFDYGKVWIDDDMLLDPDHDSNGINTSIGGGIFADIASLMTANISAFNSDDGLRLAFRFGFGF